MNDVFLRPRRIARLWLRQAQPCGPRPLYSALSVRSHSLPARVSRVVGAILRSVYLGLLFTPVILGAPVAYFFFPASSTWIYGLLRWTMAHAGPTAVKFSQWVSSRPDVFPQALCSSLATMQHTAPAHSAEFSRHCIDTELLAATNHAIDYNAVVGSGAVAQVYHGTYNGHPAAFKILHPHITELIDMDLMVLKAWGKILNLIPSVRFLNIEMALDAFSRDMQNQLSMEREALNLCRFRAMFAKDRMGVSFPQPLASTKNVLVMSWEKGEILTDLLEDPLVDSAERKKIAKQGLHVFFKMLSSGFMHGDLHAGNILWDKNCVSIVDCGLAVDLSNKQKEDFRALYKALVWANGELAATEMLARGGHIDNVTNDEAFIKEMRDMFSEIAGSFALAPLSNTLVGVLESAQRNHVFLDSSFVTLISSCVVLEGTARRLDPTLSLFDMPMLDM